MSQVLLHPGIENSFNYYWQESEIDKMNCELDADMLAGSPAD
jgi:hypothetical protein